MSSSLSLSFFSSSSPLQYPLLLSFLLFNFHSIIFYCKFSPSSLGPPSNRTCHHLSLVAAYAPVPRGIRRNPYFACSSNHQPPLFTRVVSLFICLVLIRPRCLLATPLPCARRGYFLSISLSLFLSLPLSHGARTHAEESCILVSI